MHESNAADGTRLCGALSLVAALFVASCAPDAKAPSKPSTATLFFSNVELAPGRTFPSPLVRGSVNGKDTVFIVDTGAQVSVVDAEVAKQAGLVVSEGGRAFDPSGVSVAMAKTDAPNVVIEGLGAMPNRRSAVIAIPPPLKTLGIGGILSPQMIAQGGHQVVLDLPRRELRLDDPAAATKVSSTVFDVGPIQVCRYDDGGFSAASLITQMVIDGVQTPVELDTGASTTFVVTDSAIGKKLAARSDGEHKTSVTAAGEIETARYANVPASLGEFNASGPLVTMPGKRLGACGYEGRIGIDRLRTCTLVIAQNDARATCSKPAD